MLIYKYTSARAAKLIIEKASVRFSQVDVLNDPFELTPSLETFTKTIKQFVRESRIFKDNSARMGFVERESKIQSIVQPSIDVVQELARSSLILSLTKRPDNDLMWSHYADSHCGVVMGFDCDSEFFHQVTHPEITKIYDVRYSDDRPEFFDFDNFWKGNVSVDDYRSMLLTKGIRWSYEEEARMFASPNALKNNGNDMKGFDIYLCDFPPECLKRIIFGSAMTVSERADITAEAKTGYPSIEFLQESNSATTFRLEITPVSP